MLYHKIDKRAWLRFCLKYRYEPSFLSTKLINCEAHKAVSYLTLEPGRHYFHYIGSSCRSKVTRPQSQLKLVDQCWHFENINFSGVIFVN